MSVYGDHAELTRRFRERDKEATSAILRRQLGKFGGTTALTWASLLPEPGKELAIHGVVLEAGSGTGKSTETEAQAYRLRANGLAAFFCTARRVATVGVLGALSEYDAEAFRKWKSSADVGIFFVDAVDEVYLEHRQSTDLFRELERDIGFESANVVLIMTARTGTWGVHESTLLRRCLGLRDTRRTRPVQRGKTRAKMSAAVLRAPTAAGGPWTPTIKYVTFEPLDIADVRELASFYEANDAERFTRTFDENEVTDFMELRPRDVELLVGYWNVHDCLGSWTDIAKWLVTWTYPELNPERHVRALSLVEYAEGLKRVAAAAVLTKQLHVVLPTALALPGATHACLLFPDWSPAKLAELFSSPMFVPKAESAVQLPQGAVTQCLAALWFSARYQADRDLQSLIDSVFAVIAGQTGKHLPESRRPVAGWLATNVVDFRKPLREIAPDVLLHFGDPAGLDPTEISNGIRELVARRAVRSWEWPSPGTLARLARPEVEDTIAELIAHESDPEMLWHLLRVAEARRYPKCIALARELALDERRAGRAHGVAIRILRRWGNDDDKRALRALLGTGSLETKAALVSTLVPDLLDARELSVLLMAGCNYSVAFAFAAQCSKLSAADLDVVIEAMDAKLFAAPARTDRAHRAPFNDASEPALVHAACNALIRRFSLPLPHRLPRYLERLPIAIQLVVEHEHVDNDLLNELNNALRNNLQARRGVWKEKLLLLARDGHMHNHSASVVGPLLPEDFGWLDAESMKPSNALRRDNVRSAIVDAYLGLDDARRKTARAGTSGQLAEALDAADAWQRNKNAASRRRQLLVDRKAKATRKKNQNHVRPRIERVRRGEDTHLLLWAWQQLRSNPNERARVTTEGLVELVGSDLADDFLTGFAAMWRSYAVDIPKAGSNQVLFTTLMALTGVTVDHQRGLDFRSLPPTEARRAALLAAHEMNGFPAWMPLLVGAQRAAARSALFDTISNEWDCPTENHGVLRFAPWEPLDVASLVKEIVLELASNRAPAHPKTTKYATDAILTSPSGLEHASTLARGMVRTTMDSPAACAEWLRLWAHTAPMDAATWLESLRSTMPALFDDLVLRVAAMLGQDFDRDGGRVSSRFFDSQGVRAWAPLLVDAVQPAQDTSRAGAHVGGDRDNAQTLREKCLSALTQEGSPESRGVLAQLGKASAGTPFGESIVRALSAHEKYAAENAAEPWTVEAILDFERGRTSTPTSSAALFSLVQRHLRQIGESQEAGDFSHRELFAQSARKVGQKSIRVELGIQRWVAATLQLLARGVYAVQREEEVQDENSVDICARVPGVSRLPIEIKPIGRYTEKQLRATIQEQLLGKYMRPREVTHGMLLLVQLGNRTHKVGKASSASYRELHEALSEFARGFAVSHGKVISVETISLAQPLAQRPGQPRTGTRQTANTRGRASKRP